MKTFLALVVLSLATSVTMQASSSDLSPVITGQSGITRSLPRPRPRLIGADQDTKRQPPRVMIGSVDGSDFMSLRPRPRFTAVEVTNPNGARPRPKLSERGSIRKPHFSESGLIAAQSRPKPPGAV